MYKAPYVELTLLRTKRANQDANSGALLIGVAAGPVVVGLAVIAGASAVIGGSEIGKYGKSAGEKFYEWKQDLTNP